MPEDIVSERHQEQRTLVEMVAELKAVIAESEADPERLKYHFGHFVGAS